jgi:O-antigen ligase
MLKNNKTLKLIILFETIIFLLVILGILPRSVVPYFVTIISLYLIIAPLDDGILFFIASIPMFLAIPITASFDNFNSWRIFSIILFLKWAYIHGIASLRIIYTKYTKTAIAQRQSLLWFLREYAISITVILLLILAVASVAVAGDKITAVKRIIYFLNLGLIGFPLSRLVTDKEYAKKAIEYISYPIILVTLVGLAQLVSTYFIDIYQFMRLWGENIQCNQFGQQWCYIAVNVGNTWLAYYGDQLSLRIFSLFPDSHSFPIFLLLGLPAIFAIAMRNMKLSDKLRKLFLTRTKLFIVWVPLIFLAMILTGTRGIWAAGVGAIILIVILLIYMHIRNEGHTKYFGFISGYIVLFFMLFAVAYPIFISPQFLLSKGDLGMFGNRIRSVIDFGETSNAQRILIWKQTLVSIQKHPLLGVGIGNYPVVLSQDIKLSKAGSSAHNLYLHMAAEMGILALLATLIFLIALFIRIYNKFVAERDVMLATYYGLALIFIPWVFAYLMTDVAIFDERAFLMFVVTATLLIKNPD